MRSSTYAHHLTHDTLIFHFNLYCRGTLVDTFVTECREDFEEVVAYARAVKERGIQERKPITMDMLPDLKAALIATVRASLPGPRARVFFFVRRVFFSTCFAN